MADKANSQLGKIKSLLCDLAQVSGPTNAEGPRLEFLNSFLTRAGVKTGVDAAGNIHVQFGDADRWGECLVLDAHVDVVDSGVCENVEFEDDRMIGLGVGDDLAAVAILAVFACNTVESGRADNWQGRPVRIIFTVGEEGLGNLRGVRQVVNDLECEGKSGAPAMYMAIDGNRSSLYSSGVGSSRYRLAVSAAGGHSWANYGRTSATAKLVELLGDIAKMHGEIAAKAGEGDAKLSYNIGILTGGEGINCISRDAVASFEFRSESSELLTEAHTKLADMLENIDVGDDVGLELEIIGLRPAAAAVGSDDFIAVLKQIWSDRGLSFGVKPASTNINMTLAAGWPSVCIGLCDCGNAHRPDEFVMTETLQSGYELLEAVVENHCKS